jgi:hypothetical protein
MQTLWGPQSLVQNSHFSAIHISVIHSSGHPQFGPSTVRAISAHFGHPFLVIHNSVIHDSGVLSWHDLALANTGIYSIPSLEQAETGLKRKHAGAAKYKQGREDGDTASIGLTASRR